MNCFCCLFYYSPQGCQGIHVDLARAVTRSIRMTQIEGCDWLPEQASWRHLGRSGLPAVSRNKNYLKSHIRIFFSIDQLCSVKMAGCFVFVFESVWTSASSRSINTS